MWSELSATQETVIGKASCLQLRCNAIQGTILVRECYKGLSKEIQHHFAHQGKIFIIIGNSGDPFSEVLVWCPPELLMPDALTGRTSLIQNIFDVSLCCRNWQRRISVILHVAACQIQCHYCLGKSGCRGSGQAQSAGGLGGSAGCLL